MWFCRKKSSLPNTPDRVKQSTSPKVQDRIRKVTESRIAEYSKHPADIQNRLSQLDKEWDIERTLEVNASIIGLAGLALGAFVNKKFLVLPTVVGGFLLQHAIQGWCPPLPLFRRMGKRTQREIDNERFALKALRGDFNMTPGFGEAAPQEAAKRTLRVVTA